MKVLASVLISAGLSSSAFAGASLPAKASLFEVSRAGLTASTQVEDSVFSYQPEELACDPNGDEEAPCLATVDHWETVCFQGEIEVVCSQLSKLFAASSKLLIDGGAEEDVKLLGCSIDSGIPTLDFDLISYYDGSSVAIRNKLIPTCPVFVK